MEKEVEEGEKAVEWSEREVHAGREGCRTRAGI